MLRHSVSHRNDKKSGFSVEDLSPETLESVLKVVASAESIGAQAGITKKEK